MKVMPARGWNSGETPVAPAGLRVQAFATGFLFRASSTRCLTVTCCCRIQWPESARLPAEGLHRREDKSFVGFRGSRRPEDQPVGPRRRWHRFRWVQSKLLQLFHGMPELPSVSFSASGIRMFDRAQPLSSQVPEL